MYVVAVDPGTTKSAWVLVDEQLRPLGWGWEDNVDVLGRSFEGPSGHPIWRFGDDSHEWVADYDLVIEDVTTFGKPTGRDTFETVRWSGRFDAHLRAKFYTRQTVLTHVTGSAHGKKANVRQAVIDRYGGDEVAIGGKKCVMCNGVGSIGVPGTRKRHSVSEEREVCGTCEGRGHAPRGVLYEFSKAGMGPHGWDALALALAHVGGVE